MLFYNENLGKYFRTIIYLKPIQLYYQLRYKILGLNQSSTVNYSKSRVFKFKILKPFKSYKPENISFNFLNISVAFKNKIDWNHLKHGKLWCYNLNYFDYLNQDDLKKNEGLFLIYDYIKFHKEDGLEPYPTSLRIINWIKFISRFNIDDKRINDHLYLDLSRLSRNLEFHLLANHLLENAFAIWFGAHFFSDQKLLNLSKRLLSNQLNEQILKDGAHYELSPMYHQIILIRLLEAISIAKSNTNNCNLSFLPFLIDKAELMLGWSKNLYSITDDIVRINDSVEGIVRGYIDLLDFANNLNIFPKSMPFSDSGFRIIKSSSLSMLLDISEITPSYQPGHSHADTFNFIVYNENSPFIVDPGISTYESNEYRFNERSTSYHNTICINNYNNNEVWSSFRVARRAKVEVIKDSPNYIIAKHNGYRKLKTVHKRKWLTRKDSLIIIDEIESSKSILSIAYFHFHPDVLDFKIEENKINFSEMKIEMTLIGSICKIDKEKYSYALGFNNRIDALKLRVTFEDELVTKIKIK